MVERICVDTALDAKKRGATIRNYTEVIGINKITEHWNIQLRECALEKHGLANVQAKIVINAAGYGSILFPMQVEKTKKNYWY